MSVDPHSAYALVTSELLPGMVLDVAGYSTKPETPVIAHAQKSSSTANQLWQFVLAQPGWWTIETMMGTGYVMTIADPQPGTPIVVAPARADYDGQLWSLVPTGDPGYWSLQSASNGLVLSLPDPPVADAVAVAAKRAYADRSQAFACAPAVVQ